MMTDDKANVSPGEQTGQDALAQDNAMGGSQTEELGAKDGGEGITPGRPESVNDDETRREKGDG